VSTTEQTVTNQLLALSQRGYTVPPAREVTEIISGGVCAMERPQFRNMVQNKLEPGDELIVLKLDRLGRDMIDVLSTVDMLRAKGIIVKLGRPNAVSTERIQECKREGLSQSMTAKELAVSIATVKRYWNYAK